MAGRRDRSGRLRGISQSLTEKTIERRRERRPSAIPTASFYLNRMSRRSHRRVGKGRSGCRRAGVQFSFARETLSENSML
jgi:hypothetical protein